jgi:hypothetical protein
MVSATAAQPLHRKSLHFKLLSPASRERITNRGEPAKLGGLVGGPQFGPLKANPPTLDGSLPTRVHTRPAMVPDGSGPGDLEERGKG